MIDAQKYNITYYYRNCTCNKCDTKWTYTQDDNGVKSLFWWRCPNNCNINSELTPEEIKNKDRYNVLDSQIKNAQDRRKAVVVQPTTKGTKNG